jgi:hypothetical protein
MISTSKFVEAIRRNPSVANELNPMTFWRYVNGQFPKALRWLMQHPELLRALADDAEAAQINNQKQAA